MIVCVCHRVSDRDIEREVRLGCDSFEELQDELRVATACGRCADCARDTFDVARACRRRRAEMAAASARARHPHRAGGPLAALSRLSARGRRRGPLGQPSSCR